MLEIAAGVFLIWCIVLLQTDPSWGSYSSQLSLASTDTNRPCWATARHQTSNNKHNANLCESVLYWAAGVYGTA